MEYDYEAMEASIKKMNDINTNLYSTVSSISTNLDNLKKYYNGGKKNYDSRFKKIISNLEIIEDEFKKSISFVQDTLTTAKRSDIAIESDLEDIFK